MDSVVLYHCDDKELFKTLQVLQFLPQCKVGAQLVIFANEPFADEYYANSENSSNKLNEIEVVERYVKCMKTQIRLARNYSQELPASKSSSCKDRLEENEKLKFQFKWVYFQDFTQYLIPFGAVVGTLMLAFITGTIWDCFRKKKAYECATKRGNRIINVRMCLKEMKLKPDPLYGLPLNTDNFCHCCQPQYTYLKTGSNYYHEDALCQGDNHCLFTKG